MVAAPVSHAFRIVEEGVLLHLLVSPKSSRDELMGLEVFGTDGKSHTVLRVRVRAIPDKGAANKAVIKLIAKWLGMAKSHISLHSGSKARHKVLLIEGEGAELLNTLETLMLK